MWNHTETFWWPFFGWEEFWIYKPMNTPAEMFNVYVDIIVRYPQVWVVELAAVMIFVWVAIRYRLYQWPSLKVFLWTGRAWAATKSSKPEKINFNATEIG
jgi:hypothetical protein